MKHPSVKSLVICLRVCITLLVLCTLSLFLFSFVTATKMGDELWKQLGVNKQQGHEGIYRSFTGGYLYHYDARNVKNIALGNRLAVAKDLLGYARQYISSEAFKKEYALERKNAMPAGPEAKPVRTKQQVQKEEIEKTEKSIREMEKSLKVLEGDMKKSLLPVLDMMKKTLKEYQDPNHKYFESLVLYDKMENERAAERYQYDMKKWKENYPEDFTPVIKERLQKFLELTKDVDFNAELKTSYNLKRFVNPVYERKPTEWKQAYRAGKEVTEYARAFAEKWLSEIK